MGQITSLFVHKIVRQVHNSLDKKDLLQSIGLNPDAEIDPSIMVTDTDYYDFLEKIASLDPAATTLPLRTGASMRCDEYGAFGLAWKSALNLRGSYERAERYARVLTSVSTYEVRNTAQGAYMLLHREGERRLGLRLSNEATIASVASISQQVSSEKFTPLAIYFKHPPPSSIKEHEQHFGCPVIFDSEIDGLLVSNETLLRPNLLGDLSISKFFDTHLEEQLSNFEDDTTLDHQVRIQIAKCLSNGIPTITEIATTLAMSPRTLQRRLSDQGLSFQTIVDEARRQLAQRLLGETQYSIAEISFLTGFSEQSAFNRAFKRWEGQTPRSYRISTN